MSESNELSRRGFLGKSAVAGGASLAVPLVVSSNALGQPGNPGANEKIGVGLIGCGGMGQANLCRVRRPAGRGGHRRLRRVEAAPRRRRRPVQADLQGVPRLPRDARSRRTSTR